METLIFLSFNVCALEILSSAGQLSSKYCFFARTKFPPIQPNVKYTQYIVLWKMPSTSSQKEWGPGARFANLLTK